MKTNIKELQAGDVFSEESHYVFLSKTAKGYEFKHLESTQTVTLDEKYVSELLTGADQFQTEVEVGKEDKYWTAKQISEYRGAPKDIANVRVGDIKVKGIRSIWAELYSSKVFTVCFNKQGKELSTKAFTEAKEKQSEEALAKIEAAYKGKRGVAAAAKAVIQSLIDNPVLPGVKGEERILRGYKKQFSSVNGMYDVIDMDVTVGEPVRKVNVNEINWLVVDGVKYTVK